MAGENDKGPKRLDWREVLKGLSTVPALGLFGYAWNKQRQHQQARAEAAAARPWRPPTCK